MAKQTLKERYDSKLNVKSNINESPTDRPLLFEQLILEKFDKETMVQATQIVKALKSIDFGSAGLSSLGAARDAAVEDANKVVSGVSNRGVIRQIVNLFKKDGDNPLVDTLAFSDAIHNFFEEFVPWLEVNRGGQDADDLSIQEMITGVSTDDASSIEAAGVSNSDVQQKLKDLEKLITKGLKPDGALANVGKSWQKKYFKNNYKQLANEIMNSNVETIKDVGDSVIKALANSQAVGQAAAGATQVASTSTTGTVGTEKAQGTAPTGASAPSSETEKSAKTGSAQDSGDPEAEAKANKKAEVIFNQISGDFGDLDPDVVKNVIAVLAFNKRVK